MPFHINPKKSPAWAKKARAGANPEGSQASPEGPHATERPARDNSPALRSEAPRKPVHRPDSLVGATERGWQLGTHYEGDKPLVYAWKPGGERTPHYPPGPITTEATWYGPALRAASDIDRGVCPAQMAAGREGE